MDIYLTVPCDRHRVREFLLAHPAPLRLEVRLDDVPSADVAVLRGPQADDVLELRAQERALTGRGAEAAVASRLRTSGRVAWRRAQGRDAPPKEVQHAGRAVHAPRTVVMVQGAQLRAQAGKRWR